MMKIAKVVKNNFSYAVRKTGKEVASVFSKYLLATTIVIGCSTQFSVGRVEWYNYKPTQNMFKKPDTIYGDVVVKLDDNVNITIKDARILVYGEDDFKVYEKDDKGNWVLRVTGGYFGSYYYIKGNKGMDDLDYVGDVYNKVEIKVKGRKK